MNNLNIFVSSTCYDLSQIRANMHDFISDSGHNPILSEINNFPVATNLTAVENCINNVRLHADILILIIGSRYGSVISTGKSITNTEFLAARQKGIPIFCFIEKGILNALNFYKDNPTGNFQNIVDDVKIFDFVDEIKNKTNRWIFPFEHSKEIIETLKIQLSYLFKESLRVKNIFDNELESFSNLPLSIKCQKILAEKNKYFEFDFFAQTFIDEVEKKEILKNDVEYSILTEPKHFIKDLAELGKWGSQRMQVVLQITGNLQSLLPVIQKFLGEPGAPSDIKGLYYVSVKYAQIVEQLLTWMIDVKSTSLDDDFEEIKYDLADIPSGVLETIWRYPFGIKDQLQHIKEQELLGNIVTNIDFNMVLNINEDALQRFNKRIKQLTDGLM